MSSKKPKRFLSIQDKSEILIKLSTGSSAKVLSQQYGVYKSTIYRIKKNESAVKKFVSKCESGPGKRMTIKTAEYPRMEKALYSWFLKMRSKHVPVSTDLIREKAKSIHNKIKEGSGLFNASKGWVQKFKKRHGIRRLKIVGEKVSSRNELVEPFLKELESKIKEKDLCFEQIYNADETGLFWRMLPDKTLVHFKEKSAPGRKMSKEANLPSMH